MKTIERRKAANSPSVDKSNVKKDTIERDTRRRRPLFVRIC
uniref:Uncharacterized protein n=1 Tax=Tetraselmis sp. GSL018 TaxID=582737 RepID=A0A061SCE7_9CHLO